MSESQKEWLLMVDGASRGNPGAAGCGAVILDENGAVVKELSRYLEALLQSGAKKIVVKSDSQLLVRQLNGEYRVKDEKLKVLFERAKSLLRQFESCRIVHVRREMNKLADRLANRGIDDAAKQ